MINKHVPGNSYLKIMAKKSTVAAITFLTDQSPVLYFHYENLHNPCWYWFLIFLIPVNELAFLPPGKSMLFMNEFCHISPG